MWWSTDGLVPWIIFASIIAILLPAICVMVAFTWPRAVASVARLLRPRALSR